MLVDECLSDCVNPLWPLATAVIARHCSGVDSEMPSVGSDEFMEVE